MYSETMVGLVWNYLGNSQTFVRTSYHVLIYENIKPTKSIEKSTLLWFKPSNMTSIFNLMTVQIPFKFISIDKTVTVLLFGRDKVITKIEDIYSFIWWTCKLQPAAKLENAKRGVVVLTKI